MRRSGTWFLSTLESFSGKPEAGPTGVVESPTVRIDGREVAFWIGGGKRGVHFALIDRETGREEERDRVITWLDINAPYWPCYEFAFPDSYGGRMPITRTEHDELQKITGVSIPRTFSPPRREQLNFDRPEHSRILDAVKGKPAYNTALAIIRKGQEHLKATPRADMDGFVPCAENKAFKTRYRKRQECERRSYDAIRTGRMIYDD